MRSVLKRFVDLLCVGCLCYGVSALACDLYLPSFEELLARPMKAVVIGHFVSEQNDGKAVQGSKDFVVDEVLVGQLPLKKFQLKVTGPMGGMCQISTVDVEASSAPQDNPVLLLVEGQIDGETLNLPFSFAGTVIKEGKIKVLRTSSFDPKNKKWLYLAKVQNMSIEVTALQKWLHSDRSKALPVLISKDD